MKNILNDPKTYTNEDPLQVYRSLSNFGQQFISSWHESQLLNLSFDPKDVANIVVAGMGGSNLAAHIIQGMSPLLLKVPYEIVPNYRLPQYCSSNTLVILISYSGNTEETLSCLQDALIRHCPTIVITSGGKMKDIAIKQHLPLIHIDDSLNQSKVPRFGLGFTFGALAGLLVRINPSASRYFDTEEIVRTFDKYLNQLNISTPENAAKTLAQKNRGYSIILLSANHLTGVAKTATNFFNETSKTFSVSLAIPDANHHLLDGLEFPVSLKENTRFIILDSALYPELIQKRCLVTKEILIKQKYQLTVIKSESDTIISQVIESLVFLLMFSYYLCIANHQNPGTNPWVDYFKKQLV